MLVAIIYDHLYCDIHEVDFRKRFSTVVHSYILLSKQEELIEVDIVGISVAFMVVHFVLFSKR